MNRSIGTQAPPSFLRRIGFLRRTGFLRRIGGLWTLAGIALVWAGSQGCATRDDVVGPGDDAPARAGCLACHADSDRLQALLPAGGRSAGVERALDDG